MNPLTQIPALYRKYIYTGYSAIGVVLGAIQVAYLAVPGGQQPTWLTVTMVVMGYLGTALGITAASNVGPQDTPPPAPAE